MKKIRYQKCCVGSCFQIFTTTQLYIIKVFYKQFRCYHHINNNCLLQILSADSGQTDMTKVLVEAGASLSAVDNEVIKPSVKLRQ
jgi:hypothetical protein